MPKYYEDIEEEKSKKKFACEGLRDDLLECLLNTDCVKKVSDFQFFFPT